MASIHKSIRSSTASKRPTSAIADGQIALNTASGTPGIFFKDNAGNIIKAGPAHYGASAPNSAPATGGSTGNSIGEAWLDSSLTPAGWKVWNGSAWVNATPLSSDTVQGLVELATNAETQAGVDTARAVTSAGLQSKVSDSVSTASASGIASSTAVKTAYDLANAALPKSGGIITGNLEIGSTGSLSFEGSTADAFETTLTVADPTADRTITLPNATGTLITTGDTGSVTNTMIASGTIVDATINNAAAIAGTKINPDFGGQNITTSGNIVAANYIAPSGTAIAPSIQVGSGVFYPPGIYSPGADQLAITTSGVTRLLADGNGCITVGTSLGSRTRFYTISGTLSAGVRSSAYTGFLVQPPTAFDGNFLAPSASTYETVFIDSALVNNGTSNSVHKSLRVSSNLALTSSGTGAYSMVGIENIVSRSCPNDNASNTVNITGSTSTVTMGTTLGSAASSLQLHGHRSFVNSNVGVATSTILGTGSIVNLGTVPNYSSSTFSIQGFQSNLAIGAASGTGTGVATNAYGLLSILDIGATGQLTNYYHLKLNTPTVSGTLTNRYSVWSEDAAAIMYIAGKIGVGTDIPSYQIQLSTDSAGKPSTNTWTVVSDERIKEDIELANLDICYAAIKNIPLKRFKWKDEVYSAEQVGDRRKLGWIAQDVEAVFPKAVRIKEFKYNQKFEETIIPAIENEFDDDGNVIKEGQPQSIDKKLISEDVIKDCRDLNADQLYAAMYGAVQKLISKVEALEDTVAILKDGAT
jgi:hypothetical protein